MKNKIQKKFNKIGSLMKSLKNYEIIINIITNDFIYIYLHMEKILYNTKFKEKFGEGQIRALFRKV